MASCRSPVWFSGNKVVQHSAPSCCLCVKKKKKHISSGGVLTYRQEAAVLFSSGAENVKRLREFHQALNRDTDS